MGMTLINLPNELLHQILGVKVSAFPRYDEGNLTWNQWWTDLQAKKGMLRSLRATCRQFHAAYQDVFLNEYLKFIPAGLTTTDVFVLSRLPTDAKVYPQNITLGPRDVPEEDIPTATSTAAAINRFRELKDFLLYGTDDDGFQLDSAFYHELINELMLINLTTLGFLNITLSVSEVIAFMSRQPNLTYLDLDTVNLSSGTWDKVFAACKLLPIREIDVRDMKEHGKLVCPPYDDDVDEAEEFNIGPCHLGSCLRLTNSEDEGCLWHFRSNSQIESQECLDLFVALYKVQRRYRVVRKNEAKRKKGSKRDTKVTAM